jgi:hypothetical protein
VVLVTVFELKPKRDSCARKLLWMDIDVLGYVPEDPVKGMEVLTKVFRRLELNYLNRQYWGTPLGEIGYFISELSRDKIYLVTVPEDTYHYESCVKSWTSNSCIPIYVFIDVGSPFRHIILVREKREEGIPQSKSFLITGLGIDFYEYYSLWVTFRTADWILWNCTESFCTEEYVETVEKLASDEEIHFEVYPRADEETKRLFNAIMNAVVHAKQKRTQRGASV